MNNPLYQFIQEKKPLLEKGEVFTILFKDCYLTVFNEVDKETSKQRTVTLVDTCDEKVCYDLNSVIEMAGY